MPKLTKSVWTEKKPYSRQGREVSEHSQRYHVLTDEAKQLRMYPVHRELKRKAPRIPPSELGLKPSPVLPLKYRKRILRGEPAIQTQDEIRELFESPPPVVLEVMIAQKSAELGRPLSPMERYELKNQAAKAIMKRAQIEEERTKPYLSTIKGIHTELRGQRKVLLKHESLNYDIKGNFVKEFMRPNFRDSKGNAHFLVDGKEYIVKEKDDLWHVFEQKPDGSVNRVFKTKKGFSNEYMAWRNALNTWGINPARIWEETNHPEEREKVLLAKRRVNRATTLQNILNMRVESLGGTKNPKVISAGNWIKIQGSGPRGTFTPEQTQAISDLGLVRKNGELITSIKPDKSDVVISQALDKVSSLEVADRKREAEDLWLALHPSKVRREGEWSKDIRFFENTTFKSYEIKFKKKPPKKVREALNRIGFDHSKSERYWIIPKEEISPPMLAVVENKIVGYIPSQVSEASIKRRVRGFKREKLVTEKIPASLGRAKVRKRIEPLKPQKKPRKDWEYFAVWGKKRVVSHLREDRANKVLENIKRDPQHYAKLGKGDPRTLRKLYRVPAQWKTKEARNKIREHDSLVKLIYKEKKVK